jgi:hypothetical protein
MFLCSTVETTCSVDEFKEKFEEYEADSDKHEIFKAELEKIKDAMSNEKALD